MVERLFLTVPQGCLQFVIVVFPDHTHLLFFISDHLIVSKFHNETHDPKGQENKIYTLVKTVYFVVNPIMLGNLLSSLIAY